MFALSTCFILSRLSAIAVMIYFYTAVKVLIINPKGTANIVAFFYNLVFAIWAIGAVFWYDAPTKLQAYELYRMFFWCWCVFPPITLHFFLEIGFPYNLSYAKYRTPLLLLLYIPAVYFIFLRDKILGLPVFQGGYWMVGIKPGIHYLLFSLHYIIYIATGLLLLFIQLLRTKNPIEKSAYTIFIFTGLFPLVFSIVTDLLFIVYKIDFPNLAILWILILSLGFYYAISRFGFMSRFPLQKNLLNSVSDLVIVCDTQLHILWGNDQILYATNCNNILALRENKINTIFFNVNLDKIKQVALGQEKFFYEKGLLGIQKIPVEIRVSAMQNFQQPSGALIVANDISNVQAKEKAEQNAQIQRLVLEHFITFSMDGILLADADGTVMYWNVAMEIITGINSKMAAGRKIWEIQGMLVPQEQRSPDDPIKYKKQFITVLLGEANTGNFYKEQEIERQDGVHRIVQTTNFAIPVPGTQYFGSIVRDITKEKVANENFFEQLQKMHTLKNIEAISTLSRGLAHDFNNNLTGISLAIALIQDKLKSQEKISCDEFEKEIHILSLASQRALALTKKLASFTKKEEEYKLFPIQTAVKNVYDFAKLNAGTNVTIELDSSITEKVLVFGDQHQLEQAMLNLLSNAEYAITQKTSSEQGMITIKAELETTKKLSVYSYSSKPPTFVHITIKDNGIGIHDENLKLIFEPFFTTKENESNSGLGLTMAYGIIKQHDGTIEVKSKINEGSEFSIYIPIHTTTQNNEIKIKQNRSYIFIIDRESNITQRLENLLVYLNYSSVIASSLEQIEETRSIFTPITAFVINPILFANATDSEIEKLGALTQQTPILFLGSPSHDNKLSQWLNDCKRITKVISYSFTITELGKELFEAQWELTHHEE